MILHDSIYVWEGWDGKRFLGKGRCRLRIYKLGKTTNKKLSHLKSTVVVVTDIPGSDMKVKDYADLIASWATKEFSIDPHRMLWIEYYPSEAEGLRPAPEKYDAVDFSWREGKATQAKRRSLGAPMLDTVKNLMSGGG
jgi:hypothetical protein